MPFKRHRIRWVALPLLVSTPAAYGDAGLPLLPVACSGMLMALVPVALVEALVIWRRLPRPFGDCVRTSFQANAISTVVGIPLTWFVMVLPEMFCAGGAYGLETWQKRVFAVTAQAAWLIPYEDDLQWMIPAALTFMIIPFFFVSIAIEHRVIARKWKELPRKSILSAVVVANIVTYAFLAAVLLLQLRATLGR